MADGFSKPWQEAINEMTGTPEMTASSFIKYFSPLYDFLEQENIANGRCIGWGGKNTTLLIIISPTGIFTRVLLSILFEMPSPWKLLSAESSSFVTVGQ